MVNAFNCSPVKEVSESDTNFWECQLAEEQEECNQIAAIFEDVAQEHIKLDCKKVSKSKHML